MGFWADFVAFNANAFYTITYFLWSNALVILGMAGIVYCFLADEIHEHETDVRNDRTIL